MTKDYPGEQWKNVKFDFEFVNECRLQISNFGRVRSFNKISDGNIIKGSMINGYRIIRMKFFKERETKIQNEIYNAQQQILRLGKQIRSLKEKKESKSVISEATERLVTLKKNLTQKIKNDQKKRTIYYHSLIHRLVANYFIKEPSAAHTVVAHMDHNKLNNRAYNLKWMTAEENYAHQKNSPLVIAEKKLRLSRLKPGPTTKLTVTKVMLLKKLLNQNKPIKQLVKQFKVTDTQIIRIKKGENWGDIKAAK